MKEIDTKCKKILTLSDCLAELELNVEETCIDLKDVKFDFRRVRLG